MKNKSSNENMDQILQKLANIKKVEPDTDLFLSINNRLQSREKINPTWLRAAAVIFVFLFATEMMLVRKNYSNSITNELASLVPSSNNLLYNE
jgi:maltodextrin utilization protein YvdJ